MKVLGLMSGTSADGVDAALTEIRGTGHDLQVNLMEFHGLAYSASLRHRVLNLAENGTVSDICHFNAVLGEIFAKAAITTIKKSGLSPQAVQLIGSHGQTIYHRPQPVRETRLGLIRSTLQIGDPAIIAERTGITTVANFRARDLAAGGEGAPLTPYTHYLLFGHKTFSRLVVNLGGIANVTFLPAGGSIPHVRAFDTGPCNMLLDGLACALSDGKQAMDRGGKLAKRGVVDSTILRNLLAHPFMTQKPPKSTGREEFGAQFLARLLRKARSRHLSPQDLLATGCRFIALTMSHSRQWLKQDIHEVVVGGGGVFNQTLMSELTTAFHPIPVKRMEDCGSHSKAFEAMAFGVLAYQAFHGVCANLPAVTGARHPVILGSIVPGKGTESSS